ncbi:AlpA family transcriptional regulator [Pseudonocardia endophytica]|uniref:AlpA family transcriptional regulator n=2 Tax=Pseudonocardia endophytica TaxID=401976 RepID=A0A4R1HRM8_PSEEN|nr:AlpA family transcriptional regulator [Pseudonocardia endophytica]
MRGANDMDGRIPDQRGTQEAPFLTVAEVAERMRVSRMTVYRLVHSGELPAVRFGRSFRVPPEAVDELIESARYPGQ